ncbi:hypothetical protein Pst134EA_011530 [Puccinia striiformis f. sp. tritici]|uniref:Alpha-1,3-glucosyltransferase n=1 Tax=Puccinia striiformis f. sp. tritici PST-78 TaxID=1165861 RepID=A0A0L0V1A9_9BASI|nr:hypothetical protein Pst134EA_011530 [Puccinia striiformis f. sp. tritici]KAH9467910.1 hypothetical protein Pst134EA_011530 [Puccinia striiformis f. sp. tritici]KNE92814.1 hypothetical protein PSTG_13795 [Puccinia striiformis f. sp. tritici PST-78]
MVLSTPEWDILVFSTALKLSLLPSYRSTDFEVHRNWLAITYSLPLKRWYYDETSQWTLDYPPFFAYFEYLLSNIAVLVDPKIVELNNLEYQEWSCIAFQRVSVLVTELVLGAALLKLTRRPAEPHNQTTALAIAGSLYLHPGIIIVDHIHFQYNGFLLGILLWSIWAAREKKFCLSALLFASLLNFKHIFIYLSPPYLIYLLRGYCIEERNHDHQRSSSSSPELKSKKNIDQHPIIINNKKTLSFIKLIKLGLIVIGVCIISFGPFLIFNNDDDKDTQQVVNLSGIIQILKRLFPFKRGLNHAYWAGNIWSIYSTLDRILLKYQLSRGLIVDQSVLNSTSRGLIGDTHFAVLPTITPNTCLGLTLGFMIIIMSKLWQEPSYNRFLKSIILSAFTSFIFGWHVHEKAALLFLVPLTLIAVQDYYLYRTWLIASVAGISGLFPLLINSTETPIKLLYTFIWIGTCSRLFKRNLHRPNVSNLTIFLTKIENLYIFGSVCLHLYFEIFHSFIISSRINQTNNSLEFLPLMITSFYTSIGIIWSFSRLLVNFLFF